jgi:hypothetical protein
MVAIAIVYPFPAVVVTVAVVDVGEDIVRLIVVVGAADGVLLVLVVLLLVLLLPVVHEDKIRFILFLMRRVDRII